MSLNGRGVRLGLMMREECAPAFPPFHYQQDIFFIFKFNLFSIISYGTPSA